MLSIVNSLEPDFTGVENVFFLGAGMGFGKKEIMKKLNQILNFSEIGEFKDTPKKILSWNENKIILFYMSQFKQ